MPEVDKQIAAKTPIALKPKKNCRNCLGRGWIVTFRPDLDATKFREIRPCSCVKAVVQIGEIDQIPKSEAVQIVK